MRNKYGFTLVELLAVIVVLAIIIVIATMNVNRTIIKTRTKAYDQTMDTVVKSAKQILQTGNLDNDTLRGRLDYSKDQYNIDVKKSNESYLITLTATKTGKFNNMDFDLIDKNKNYFYEDGTVCTLLNDDGTLRKPDKCTSSSDLGGSGSDIPKSCTSFTKKDTYSVGDVISFCNKNTGKSEDFYVIKDNGDSVTALAKYGLLVGEKYFINQNGECTSKILNVSDANYGLQDVKDEEIKTGEYLYCQTAPIMVFSDNDHNRYIGGGTYTGYWSNNQSLSYPTDVFDENSSLWNPVQNYKKYFNETLNKKSVEVSLINKNELESLGCNLKLRKCDVENKTWFDDYNSWWTAVAYSEFGTFSVSKGELKESWIGSDLGSIRPVIEANKNDL